MVNKWISRPLRDCATWYSGGTPRKGNQKYWSGSIPWISAKSLTEFFVSDSEEKVTEIGADNGTRLVPKDTVLFVVRGMSLKNEFRMGITTRPVTFNQDLKALVARDDILPKFLAYAIKGRTQEILDLVGEAGHGTGVLPTDRIQGLEILVPPPEEQRAIARILGTLDDKIELNRKQNETLEAMARALFKAWFVDFEPVRAKMEGRWQRGQSLPGLPAHLYDLFPDRLVESELGEIPEGWEVTAIDAEFDVTMGQSPPGRTYNETGEGLPFYQGRADFEFRFPKRRVYCTAPTRFAKKGDTLVSVRAPVGDINMASEDCAIGRGVAAVRHKTGCRSYTYQFMNSISDVFAQFNSEGTVFGSIGKKDFHAITHVKPSRDLVLAYEGLAAPLDDQIERNERESRYLGQLRDALLPKLISGELRVVATS